MEAFTACNACNWCTLLSRAEECALLQCVSLGRIMVSESDVFGTLCFAMEAFTACNACNWCTLLSRAEECAFFSPVLAELN